MISPIVDTPFWVLLYLKFSHIKRLLLTDFVDYDGGALTPGEQCQTPRPPYSSHPKMNKTILSHLPSAPPAFEQNRFVHSVVLFIIICHKQNPGSQYFQGFKDFLGFVHEKRVMLYDWPFSSLLSLSYIALYRLFFLPNLPESIDRQGSKPYTDNSDQVPHSHGNGTAGGPKGPPLIF